MADCRSERFQLDTDKSQHYIWGNNCHALPAALFQRAAHPLEGCAAVHGALHVVPHPQSVDRLPGVTADLLVARGADHEFIVIGLAYMMRMSPISFFLFFSILVLSATTAVMSLMIIPKLIRH